MGIADTVVPLLGGNRLRIELLFQKTEKGFKEINMERIGFLDDFTDFVIDHTDKSNRAHAEFFGGLVDFVYNSTRFFRRIDKRIGMAFELNIAKLVQQGFTDIFSGQAGSVGNIEDLAWISHNESS